MFDMLESKLPRNVNSGNAAHDQLVPVLHIEDIDQHHSCREVVQFLIAKPHGLR